MSHAQPQTTKPPRALLTAELRDVIMLSFEVDPALLTGSIPSGTELDLWRGKNFISMIGLRFLNMKVLGVPIPFHRDFDQINLRFYVRRRQGNELRRGVAFLGEIVPRRAVATIARVLYNEQYVTRPTAHRLERNEAGISAQYSWAGRHDRGQLRLSVNGAPQLPAEGSLEQFIVEHYWGYSTQRDGGSVEYRVGHPPWRMWCSRDATFEGDVAGLYGRELATALKQEPTSAFLAEGSAVGVYRGRRLAVPLTAWNSSHLEP